MGQIKCLIDTNVLIYFFNGRFNEIQREFIEHLFSTSFNISAVTKIEFLGWDKHTYDSLLKARDFLRKAKIIHIDSKIENKAIEIKLQRKIKLPDSIIESTCIVKRLSLVTRNVEDFKKSSIKIINPFDI
ncbi:MAG TPA: type II toxin-antitoxin system VapC family toxin [Spirochaetota bacterium]|nr:type II toxin-antitoxin system VapC family toxin [Spirochaetota bacterium]HOS33199.1 type II toxin-antitoxin system VapC family toxin [Spirochaetota bacterium]HOS56439.1 type II toxin-antitoxin system VapC family toxin [Spirochaetota bacterium]HQF78281.1 type II toxin-antitoxin system VapC family toxin [Spirochaetota bacterium]HQH31227.1 type II toxin-antitoxin system VapC family toxin [Spirochaetota bacterium]